jgi:uncharacterized protein (DUF983 family)
MTTPGPGTSELALHFMRAMRLRCPWCGGGPVLVHWFRMRERCGACGLRLERGEPGYFVGALAVHLVALELSFALTFVFIAWQTWPDPPWDLLLWGSVGTLVVGALVGWPIAKLTWLAFDLAIRPPTENDFPGKDEAVAAAPDQA